MSDPQAAALKQRLIAMRKAKGLRQKDVAKYLNTQQSVISHWESNNRDATLSMLQRYARAVGATLIVGVLPPLEENAAGDAETPQGPILAGSRVQSEQHGQGDHLPFKSLSEENEG